MQPPEVEDDDEAEWESWGEPEVAPTRCLFTERMFDSAADCLAHANEAYNLDLQSLVVRCVIYF